MRILIQPQSRVLTLTEVTVTYVTKEILLEAVFSLLMAEQSKGPEVSFSRTYGTCDR